MSRLAVRGHQEEIANHPFWEELKETEPESLVATCWKITNNLGLLAGKEEGKHLCLSRKTKAILKAKRKQAEMFYREGHTITDDERKALRESRKKAYLSCKEDQIIRKEKKERKIAEDVRKGDSKAIWGLIKRKSLGTTKLGPVKDSKGQLQISEEDSRKTWAAHFAALGKAAEETREMVERRTESTRRGNPEDRYHTEKLNACLSEEELDATLRSLKNWKS
ncbi:MAG: uncharacterized protein A8A55_2821, partial [Amphiamblys sp. WSBS2006]